MQQEQPIPALQDDLHFTVHQQGKRLWYAVQDPSSGRFTRLGQTEYLMACAMDGRRTPAQIVESVQEICPGETACPADATRLADWLAKHGLLANSRNETTPPTGSTPTTSWSFSLLYTRIPLLPGKTLESVARKLQFLAGSYVILFVAILAIIAAFSVAAHWDTFSSNASKLFVADGRLWWIVAWLVLKAAHELGHAMVAVRVGSQIRSAGLSLICLAPVPYVDISDLWMISNRWHRMLCCAAGMLVEIGLASMAALIALTTENQSLQYLCCAVATLGTVTTLAFNINPLVRFDGYFIVSDIMNRPNLWTEANGAVRQLWRKLVHPSQPMTQRMSVGLIAYGLACLQYRVVLLTSLAIWALLVWQGLGLFLVTWGVYSMILAPWLRRRRQTQAAHEAAAGQKLGWFAQYQEQNVGLLVLGVLLALAFILPSPVQPSAPGTVALHEPLTVRNQTEGFLTHVHVQPGGRVAEGELIASLENTELELKLREKQNEVRAARESMRSLRARGELGQLQSENARLHSLKEQLNQLENQFSGLQVIATKDGRIIHSDLERQQGRFFNQGEALCLLADDSQIEITASIDQQDVEHMRAAIGRPVYVSLQSGHKTLGTLEKVAPRGSRELWEPSLAAIYGGPLTVKLEQSEGGNESLQLFEPRFQAHISLDREDHQRLVPGQTATVRIPDTRANLATGLRHWLEKKWDQLVRDTQAVQPPQ